MAEDMDAYITTEARHGFLRHFLAVCDRIGYISGVRTTRRAASRRPVRGLYVNFRFPPKVAYIEYTTVLIIWLMEGPRMSS